MDQAAIPAFAALTAGLTVFFLLYAIYSPIRPKKKISIAEGVFGDSFTDDPAQKYTRPILDNFMPSLPEGIIPKSSISKYQKMLRVSGNPLRVTPEELFVLQIAAALVGFLVGLAVAAFNAIAQVPPAAFPVIFAALAFYLPYAKHTSLRDSRAQDIQRNLPEALDLLQVVIATGSAFQPALRKVTAQLPECFLREEFTRINVELQAGATLETCLTNFSNSNISEEGAAFASAIIQTHKLGADVTDTLVRQAQLARANQEARIERMIARLGSTLFVPISMFMMPAFLIIFLAPSMTSIAKMMG